jgi:hypothetical protein
VNVIRYPQANYQPLPGIQQAITVREWKGLSSFDPLSIADNLFTSISNFVLDEYPVIATRRGYSVLGSAISTSVLGLGVWKNQQLHAVFGDGTWRVFNNNTWQTLASGLNTSARWSFTNFQGNWSDIHLVAANGVDPIKHYDGTTVADLTGAPAKGNYITTYQNRLWCAVGKEIKSCALDQPEKWELYNGDDEDSYGKEMESMAGETVNMLSGSLTKLTIGMPNSLHEMYGGVPSDFTTKMVADRIGVRNNQSVITQDGVIYFANLNGVYQYTGGILPDKSFSEVVKGFINGVSSTSCAGTDGKTLFFATHQNSILNYDPRIQAWTMLTDIDPLCFALMGENLYVGDSKGRVLQLFGAAKDGTQDVKWSLVTKPFNNSSIAQKLRMYKLWAVVDLLSTSNLKIYLSPSINGNDWVQVGEITPASDLIKHRVIIPTAKMANENYIRIKFEGTGYFKLHELTRQQRELPLY